MINKILEYIESIWIYIGSSWIYTGLMWMFLILLINQFSYFISTWQLYKKAGRKPYEAFIPFYNYFVLIRYIIKKPTYLWYILILMSFLNSLIDFKNLEVYIFDDLKHLGQRRYLYLNLILWVERSSYFFLILYIEILFIKAFGKNKPKDILLLILTFGLYIVYLNYSKNSTYKKSNLFVKN